MSNVYYVLGVMFYQAARPFIALHEFFMDRWLDSFKGE